MLQPSRRSSQEFSYWVDAEVNGAWEFKSLLRVSRRFWELYILNWLSSCNWEFELPWFPFSRLGFGDTDDAPTAARVIKNVMIQGSGWFWSRLESGIELHRPPEHPTVTLYCVFSFFKLSMELSLAKYWYLSKFLMVMVHNTRLLWTRNFDGMLSKSSCNSN